MAKNEMRILIADSQPQVRSALQLLLQEKLGAIVVGEASSLKQALELVGLEEPDLVLLDWELTSQSSSSATALVGLRAARPGLAVIALSSRPEARQRALAAGVDAFISKGDPPERLVASVNNCYRAQCPPTSPGERLPG
jgi:DNA-binding NarL/FixJ family response regulator